MELIRRDMDKGRQDQLLRARRGIIASLGAALPCPVILDCMNVPLQTSSPSYMSTHSVRIACIVNVLLVQLPRAAVIRDSYRGLRSRTASPSLAMVFSRSHGRPKLLFCL